VDVDARLWTARGPLADARLRGDARAHGYEATRERTATRRRARPRWQRSQGLAAGELGSTAGEGVGSRVAKGARQTTVTREA
jgi:hypothetical protein